MRHFPLAPELSIFSETLGKWVVVDFQLCDFVILVGCDAKEGGLWEWEDVVSAGELEAVEVVGSHNVNPGHILVHRCQNDLEKEKINSQLWYDFFHPNNFRETLKYTRIFFCSCTHEQLLRRSMGFSFQFPFTEKCWFLWEYAAAPVVSENDTNLLEEESLFLLSHASKFVALIRIFFISKTCQLLQSVWSL